MESINTALASVGDALSNMPALMTQLGSIVYNQSGDMEMYTLLGIGVIVLMWIFGSYQNKRIVNENFLKIHSVLSSQFSNPGKLVCESNSHYFVYSTGRINCSGMSTSMHLSPRQDFLSRFVFSWFAPDTMYRPDRVEVEIFDALDDAITGMLCRKYQVKKLSDEFPEITKLCKPANQCIENSVWARHNNGSSLTGFTYLADAGGKAVGGLAFGKQMVGQIHFIKYLSVSSKSIKIELTRFPANSDEWEAIYSLALFGVLDVLAPIRVSESVRAEVVAQRSAEEAKRKAAEEAEARDAALAKRQAEKKRELEESMKRMTPEALRKLEEKEKKRNMKKRAGKGIMM